MTQLFTTMLIAVVPAVAQNKEPDPMIELHARCVDDAHCRFHEGVTLNIELELRNGGSEPVSLPLEYIRQRGPSVRVHDNHTQRTTSLRTTLAAAALREQLQVLAPGQSIRFSIPVKPQDISRFALRPVDVSLEFSINLTPGLSGEDADMVSSRLRVVGAVSSS
ncbi:hypothetical protein ATCM_08375 [Stenotrophomonas sp. ATCM1_4]|uniref:hypothetical protein n=1 Tax=Stenotrophomonas sp. ATCM1_4 TaxID=2259330 RepID=UPI00104B9BE9|nr:hypothetical protein [Stenotrophomonas sp. ATCM1_4]TDB27678.1 hypothetical protein ATCM_08375 [Stenotrophomonas sp. ATCM1_4]